MELKLALLDLEKQKIKSFLKQFNLSYDNDIDYSLYIEEGGSIIGTISTSANIIKAFAVDANYKGQIASLLISEAINHIYKNGYNFYQVYTKPEYRSILAHTPLYILRTFPITFGANSSTFLYRRYSFSSPFSAARLPTCSLNTSTLGSDME